MSICLHPLDAEPEQFPHLPLTHRQYNASSSLDEDGYIEMQDIPAHARRKPVPSNPGDTPLTPSPKHSPGKRVAFVESISADYVAPEVPTNRLRSSGEQMQQRRSPRFTSNNSPSSPTMPNGHSPAKPAPLSGTPTKSALKSGNENADESTEVVRLVHGWCNKCLSALLRFHTMQTRDEIPFKHVRSIYAVVADRPPPHASQDPATPLGSAHESEVKLRETWTEALYELMREEGASTLGFGGGVLHIESEQELVLAAEEVLYRMLDWAKRQDRNTVAAEEAKARALGEEED